jgi:hypothetical protein
MPNVNSCQGFKNLPAQTIATSATPTALLTPASGLISAYPSPVNPSGTGLVLISDPDVQSSNPTATSPTYVNASLDGQAFKLRLVALITPGTASSTVFTPYIYEVPQSVLLLNTLTSGSPTSGGPTFTANDHLLYTGATVTTTATTAYNYVLEAELIWDSASGILNGYFDTLGAGTYTAAAATTPLASVTATGLNFIPFFAFSTASNSTVVVKEFLLERV